MVTAGHDGALKIGTDLMAYIDNYSLAMNTGTAEISQMGNEWKEFLATTKDWSGSASGTLDTSDTAQKKFLDGFIATGTASATIVFKISADKNLTGSVFCSSLSITASHGDKISVSFNFQGTGALSVGA